MTDDEANIEDKVGEAVGSPVDSAASDSDRTVIEFSDEEMKEPSKAPVSTPSTAVMPVARVSAPQVLPAAAPGGPLGPVINSGEKSRWFAKARKIGLGALAVALVSTGAYFIGQSTRKSDAAVDAQIAAIQAAQNKVTNGALDKQKAMYAKLTKKRADAGFKKGVKTGYSKGYGETSSPSPGAVDSAYQAGKAEGYSTGYNCGRYSTCGE